MSQRNRIIEEIEKIDIPEELRERSIMGVRQAKRELRQTGGVMKIAKVAGITAAGLVLAVALGAATSPTFAEVVKSWFSLNKTDEGLKKAADEGFAEPINKQVTDQGITLKVKEVIHDVLRISILYGIEQDGKSMDSDRLFDTFIPNGSEDDPYVNRYEIVDGNGNVLPLRLQQTHAGNDRILILSLDDLVPGQEISDMSDLPNQITVRFDINQIGKTRGKWYLDVPIDLMKAKASTTIVPLNKRYESQMGFSVDVNQLRHGPSKSELLLQVNETQAWRSAQKTDPMFRYEIKDGKGDIVAAYDGLVRRELAIGNKNVLQQSLHGQGTLGHMRYRHAFVPFEETKDLTLEMTAIYTQERFSKGDSIALDPAVLMKEPLRKEVKGKSIVFKARMKTEEVPEQMKDGYKAFQGKGWILEAEQQLGSDTLDLEWRMMDKQGKEIRAESATELEQDSQGKYRNRKLFFFEGQSEIPGSLNVSLESWTKKTPISWSIPLVPLAEPLPPGYDEPIYEMTVAELKPEIVSKAEQAMHDLAPNKPAELYGIADYSDRWFLYAKDNSESFVIVLKEAAEPITVQRAVPYHELNDKLRQTVEDTLRQMKPEQSVAFSDAVRVKSKELNNWSFHNDQASITIDAVTGQVEMAELRYEHGSFNEKAKVAAEKAYPFFAEGKALRSTTMMQRMTPTEHVWEIGRDMNLFARVGVRTNRVWSVQQSYKDDYPGDDQAARKKYATLLYTPEQAISKVDSTVKQVFGIDMEGYEVSVKLNEYTFTKKGSMTIKGTVNAKGEFWKLELIPVEGIQD
ncbi:hypothetical protein AZ66_05165 [Paenibacillus sp. E194]|uniref:DUF4179 domain-containing protein n=1 Tax=Paenibacillus sp. E194 TaxID=1458845 RepID=UPI0005C9C84D|nr:DUF4179 domain-containing protein [Paenibacillus sp. E194]KJB88848.1 hypothetical protein AZ66_05165 [Paenibacillus sp. E194]